MDFELRVSLVAEDLFELEHLTRPVIFEQDHLGVTVCLHGRQGGAQFANRHHRVLTADLRCPRARTGAERSKETGQKKCPRRDGSGHE